MTKKVNKYFMIVALFYIVITITIPIVDYFATKLKYMDKGKITNAQEMQEVTEYIYGLVDEGDMTKFNNFYAYYDDTYNYQNNGIVQKALENIYTNYNEIFTHQISTAELIYIGAILDKILILFICYCIFVIPISMVDLFYKMIKKEVD